MNRTITAIYDNGTLIPLEGKLPKKKAKVQVTILEEIEKEASGLTIIQLKKLQANISSLPNDGVQYQRELRDEW